MTTLYSAPRLPPTTAAEPQSTSACRVKPVELPKPKSITVNGVTIDRAAIARETQNHPAAKPIEAWLAAARALVVRELLLQEARRLSIEAIPAEDGEGRRETDEESLIRRLIEQEVSTPTATTDECRRFYEQNSRRFRSSPIFEVRHILLAADPKDLNARSIARTRAEAAIAALNAAPDQFSELAIDMSACPSNAAGGNLGQISHGQTIPEFEAAIDRMREGELSQQPVETRYGFHIVRLERRIEGKAIPFDVAQSRIAGWLEEKVRRTAIHQYIAGLGEVAEITGIALEDGSTSIVQ